MITKNHPSAYKTLFEKAEKVLKDNGITIGNGNEIKITNIDEYFACLQQLAELERDPSKNIDPIFTILPTTEETFEIDANKRSIKIPDNFARYGVGVQGDEVAEILYFSIDRYFDAIDLASKEILIQWKHEKDTSHSENLSATYKRSLTLIPGKIVFGWPISREMTENPGNIQFSVRFYEREGEDEDAILVYSFSTLTATIKIQPALDFSLSPSVTMAAINKNDQIYKNLRYVKTPSMDYNIAMPEFTKYYYYVITEGEVGPEQEASIVNLKHDLPVKFSVKADIPAEDEGIITSPIDYKWYYSDGENKALELIGNRGVVSKDYIPVSSATGHSPNEFYYYNAGTPEAPDYKVYSQPNDSNWFDNNVQLYILRSSCVPNTAGYYVAEASNVYSIDKSADKKSAKWLVPFAKEPVYTYEASDKKVLLDNSNTHDITITAEVDDGGQLSYQWYFSNKNFIDDYNPAAPIADATGTTITADKEGFYFLKATNSKNNSLSKNYSDPVLTSYAPSVPDIVLYKVDGTRQDTMPVILHDLGVILEVVVNPSLEHRGEITYQWYSVSKVNGEEVLTKLFGEESSQFTVVANGSYKCVVTNTYNTYTAEFESQEFGVYA